MFEAPGDGRLQPGGGIGDGKSADRAGRALERVRQRAGIRRYGGERVTSLADWATNIVNTSCSMSASPSVMRWRCSKSIGPSPGASGGDGIHSIRSR